jgi:hypothetical protein
MLMGQLVMWAGNDNPYYLGHNGEGQAKGVEVNNYNSLLHIEPINSKGNLARCVITVPLNKVDEFITALIAARGFRIGDKVKLKVKVKGVYKGGTVGWMAAGLSGTLTERMDDGQFIFQSDKMHTFVSPGEMERV